LDFSTDPSVLRFDVAVSHATLRDLPACWDLPREVTGNLTGRAKLEVVLGERTTGSGGGEGGIENARVAGFPPGEPIRLRLVTDGGGVKFRWEGKSRSENPPRQNPKPQGPAKEVVRLPQVDFSDFGFRVSDFRAAVVTAALSALAPPGPPASRQPT